MGQIPMNVQLVAYIEAAKNELSGVPPERRRDLALLADFICERRATRRVAKLVFICTHNSRRSHFGQIWAATAAAHYGIDLVEAYSGGTEATEFDRRAVAAIQRAGFSVTNPGGSNPHYQVRYAPSGPVLECFSKTYADSFNPAQGFAAVMTCAQANEACPIVKGAALKCPIQYEDPKRADDTEHEAATYDERCAQIATEMLHLFACLQ